MKRSITFAIAAAGITFALAGCGTGIESQTAVQVAAVPGYSKVHEVQGEGTVSLLNARLAYPGTEGYKSGDEAKINLTVVNTTAKPVRVVLKSSQGAVTVDGGILTLEPGKSATPDAKIKLSKDVPNGEFVLVDVEFVGLVTIPAQIPIEPPNSPAPRVTLEVKEGAGGEGH